MDNKPLLKHRANNRQQRNLERRCTLSRRDNQGFKMILNWNDLGLGILCFELLNARVLLYGNGTPSF